MLEIIGHVSVQIKYGLTDITVQLTGSTAQPNAVPKLSFCKKDLAPHTGKRGTVCIFRIKHHQGLFCKIYRHCGEKNSDLMDTRIGNTSTQLLLLLVCQIYCSSD